MGESAESALVFTINGVKYPFAGDDVTMAEAMILYDYSGVTLDKLDEIEGFNPQVLSAYMHIAVKRAEPGLSDKQIREKVGNVSASELAAALAESDAGPPDEAPSGEPVESEPSSGPSSVNGSASPQDSGQNATGPHRSEITAISARRASAV